MKLLFLYPPSPYLNHSMFKHYTYFAETVDVVSKVYPQVKVLDCAVEMKSRNEIYDSFGSCDILIIEIEPYNIKTALSLATIYKNMCPNGKTVFFGTAAVLIPNYLSCQNGVDYIVANGNFSLGIIEAIQHVNDQSSEKGIKLFPRITYGELHWGCSLDTKVPLDKYRYFDNNMFEFTVQVGCPFACSFCSEKILFPTSESFVFAQRPVKDIISILRRIKGDYDSVYFSATTLTYDRDWISTICKEMIRTNCCMPWRSDTRIDYLDSELLLLMKESGLKQLSLGIESFENHLLKSVNKRQNADTIFKKIKECKDNGVEVKALLILGLPGQSAQDVLHTQEIIEKLGIPYRWKEYSPIRELYLLDNKRISIDSLIEDFSRSSFRSNSIPGLAPEKYMSLLFPHGYVR